VSPTLFLLLTSSNQKSNENWKKTMFNSGPAELGVPGGLFFGGKDTKITLKFALSVAAIYRAPSYFSTLRRPCNLSYVKFTLK